MSAQHPVPLAGTHGQDRVGSPPSPGSPGRGAPGVVRRGARGGPGLGRGRGSAARTEVPSKSIFTVNISNSNGKQPLENRDHVITKLQKRTTIGTILAMAFFGLLFIIGGLTQISDPTSLAVIELVGICLLVLALWRAWMVIKAVQGKGTWQEAIIECVQF